MNIKKYWPYNKWQPRENQEEALNWLFNQKAKYLLLEAPTGTGKSAIGLTLSRFLSPQQGSSYILTPQRILQKQYEESHSKIENVSMASLYGKSNYQCANKNTNCEIGNLVKPRCSNCLHTKAKEKAVNLRNTVLNYKLALSSFAYTTAFDARKLMILDECHTLENHLVDFDALSITEWRCKKYEIPFKTHYELDTAIDWVKKTYIPKLTTVVDDMEDECNNIDNDPTRKQLRLLKEFKSLREHLDESIEMSLRTSSYLKENFVLTTEKTVFQFKRITGQYSFNKHLKPKAQKFLFMSSTILDKDGFCEDLGLPPEDTAFLSLQSDFPIENRPIYVMPQMKMNAAWNKDENFKGRQQMLSTVKKLLEMHPNDSGVIHTGNFGISEWLVENLYPSHNVYHHNPESGDDRNAIIDSFMGDPKPSILISPSSTEGLDLKEDLGRFAIFVKIGFPHLGDSWVKKRMEMSKKWYFRKTLTDTIQGCGRVVRSKEDTGSVFILDGSFNYLRNQTSHFFPKWWKDAIQNV